jgi:hypothetical protein
VRTRGEHWVRDQDEVAWVKGLGQLIQVAGRLGSRRGAGGVVGGGTAWHLGTIEEGGLGSPLGRQQQQPLPRVCSTPPHLQRRLVPAVPHVVGLRWARAAGREPLRAGAAAHCCARISQGRPRESSATREFQRRSSKDAPPAWTAADWIQRPLHLHALALQIFDQAVQHPAKDSHSAARTSSTRSAAAL